MDEEREREKQDGQRTHTTTAAVVASHHNIKW